MQLLGYTSAASVNIRQHACAIVSPINSFFLTIVSTKKEYVVLLYGTVKSKPIFVIT